MGWLIVLGSIAMLVGSITLMRPSVREQRQSRLRQQALKAGLRVRLQTLQLPGESEPRRLAVYTLARDQAQREVFERRRAHWLAVRAPGGGLDSIDEHWQFLESDAGARSLTGPLRELLQPLGEEVLAVASSAGAVGVYWTEEATSLQLADIHGILKDLMRLTSGAAADYL